MAVFNSFSATDSIQMGEENSVASFYKWVTTLFGAAYDVVFDKDRTDFSHKQLAKYPCIVVQQIDTIDNIEQFIGGNMGATDLLFYVYFNHHLAKGGTRQKLRRGRDQMSFALENAGLMNNSGAFIVDPVYLWDFSKNPEVRLNKVITIKTGIQQRFIQDEELLQYEFMVAAKYY